MKDQKEQEWPQFREEEKKDSLGKPSLAGALYLIISLTAATSCLGGLGLCVDAMKNGHQTRYGIERYVEGNTSRAWNLFTRPGRELTYWLRHM